MFGSPDADGSDSQRVRIPSWAPMTPTAGTQDGMLCRLPEGSRQALHEQTNYFFFDFFVDFLAAFLADFFAAFFVAM
jgi:hypothetical protein